MKNRKKKLFALLLSLPFILASCSGDNNSSSSSSSSSSQTTSVSESSSGTSSSKDSTSSEEGPNVPPTPVEKKSVEKLAPGEEADEVDYAVIINTEMDENVSAAASGSFNYTPAANPGYFPGTQSTSYNQVKRAISTDRSLVLKANPATPDAVGTNLPSTAPNYAVNDVFTKVYYTDSSMQNTIKFTYKCIKVTDKVVVWLDKTVEEKYLAGQSLEGSGTIADVGNEIAALYENKAYDIIKSLSPNPDKSIPYADRGNRLSIIIDSNMREASGLYKQDSKFTGIYINPDESYFSKDTKTGYKKGGFANSDQLFVHEGQHALFDLFSRDNATSTFNTTSLNEGLSTQMMIYTGHNNEAAPIAQFKKVYNTSNSRYEPHLEESKTLLGKFNHTYLTYGFSASYIRYLAMQYQAQNSANTIPSFYQKVYSTKLVANESVNSYMNRLLRALNIDNLPDFKTSMINYYIATVAHEEKGVYGFYNDIYSNTQLPCYPLLGGNVNESKNIAPRGAIVVEAANNKFKAPTDGGSKVEYYVVRKQTKKTQLEGKGTEAEPYLISSVNDFEIISEQMKNSYDNRDNNPSAEKYYKLTNDIDAKGRDKLLNGSFYSYGFAGKLDGNNKKIYNLSGVFCAYLKEGGEIKNLTIVPDDHVSLTFNEGLFVSYNSGTLTNCSIEGDELYVSIIPGAYEASATSNGYQHDKAVSNFGTLVGTNGYNGVIDRCSVKPVVYVIHVGLRVNATFYDVDPVTKVRCGGIVGTSYFNSQVKDCYAEKLSFKSSEASEVQEFYIGGIVGYIQHTRSFSPRIENCVLRNGLQVASTGKTENVGLAIGYIDDGFTTETYSNLYANGNSSTSQKIVGNKATTNGILTGDTYKSQSSYSGLDFTNTWTIEEGVSAPILK